MKLIAPNYYTQFTCIADRCKHSCCIGWEIDIDKETLEIYQSVSDPFGTRLRKNIIDDGDQAHFCLSDDERCPFLNEKGLCDIILNLGEEYLSQICTDHPRFCSFYGDRTEIGLGLCCEEAGRILLSQKEKTELIVLEDDGEEEILSEEEITFLELRSKLFALAQNREKTLDERMLDLLTLTGPKQAEKSFSDKVRFYLSLERMDENWTALLQSAENAVEAEHFLKDDIPAEQILVYFLYRHLSDLSEDISHAIAFAVFSVKFIRALCARCQADFHATIEICRLYSSEIEYSEENTRLLKEYLFS